MTDGPADKYRLTETQCEFRDAVRKFAEQRIAPVAAEIDESDKFPMALFEEMAALGYLGAPHPEAYGGAGADTVTVCLMLEEISRASGAVGSSLNAHIGLASSVIASHGSEAQKERYLKRMISGEAIGSFGLTEPSGGSDAAACKTRAEYRNGYYFVTGSKCFITNATVADIFVITARSGDAPGSAGVSAFILERGMDGFAIGEADRKMGMYGSPTAMLYFDEVKLSEDNRVGAEGEGFRQFAQILDRGRINVAAACVGLGQAALEASTVYAREREQFGKPIAAFQGVQWPIAEMATEIEAARLLMLNAARMDDAGQRVKKEAAMAKFHAARAALTATGAAIEIHGGAGYMRETGIERFARDAKMYEIGEGTSQIQRMVIAREILGRYDV